MFDGGASGALLLTKAGRKFADQPCEPQSLNGNAKLSDDTPIPVSGIKRGITHATNELHISGGHRAIFHSRGYWTWLTAITDVGLVSLNPLPISQIDSLSRHLGITLFGGDQISGIETKLPARTWTPLNGPNRGEPQPADLWATIGGHAERAGDDIYGRLARNLSFSVHAAGIRLRDASDRYREQLVAAIGEHHAGQRFSNIPMRDLQLAFHSVLSELASARDYLAAIFAKQIGAPPTEDALNRLHRWLQPASKAVLRATPVISDMLEAYDPASTDPWLHQLTGYRNQFLHRSPMGAASGARWLRYYVRESNGIRFPIIEYPLGSADTSAAGRDALTRFVELYRKMNALLAMAVPYATYSATTPHFIATENEGE